MIGICKIHVYYITIMMALAMSMDKFMCATMFTNIWRKNMKKGFANVTWLSNIIKTFCHRVNFFLTWIQWNPHANNMICNHNLTNNNIHCHLGNGFVDTFLAPMSVILFLLSSLPSIGFISKHFTKDSQHT